MGLSNIKKALIEFFKTQWALVRLLVFEGGMLTLAKGAYVVWRWDRLIAGDLAKKKKSGSELAEETQH